MAETQKKEEQEKLSFGADVSRLLDIVARALYSNRDIFLRELISNASDACDRLRYEAIKNPALIKDDPDFKIRVYKDAEARYLHVIDNGIGMDRDELVDHLGTIAKSGTATLMEQMGKTGSEEDRLSLIGQFGVGFYASFMVASTVKVISSKAGDDAVWVWESDGRTGFTVREASQEEKGKLMNARGTAVLLEIDKNSSEYLIDEKLEQVIATYSDHIDFPIYLGEDSETPVNTVSALWTRPKNEITEEQYAEFYRHVGHGMDEPLITAHWKAEGKIEYSALLFVPTLRPWDLYDPTRQHAVRLYVKRVFITDNCEGLIYPWLRFLRGVIDSEDLPLNISREMLQHNPLIARIRSGITKRILGDLDKLAKNDPVKFEAFWGQFGAVLKEGLYDAAEHRDDLFKVTRFYSTHEKSALTSLEDYVSRMKEEQDEIYYISGENLQNSPQLEGFKSRGLEVLFFTDTIDDFWLQSVPDYKDKPFKSVTKGNIDLSKFDTDDSKKEKDDKKQKTKEKTEDSELAPLVAKLKDILKDEVGDIVLSARLTDSPVCLVASENEVDLRMERVLRLHQQYEPQSKRTLEINPNHPLIQKIAGLTAPLSLNPSPLGEREDEPEASQGEGEPNEILEDAAHLLLDQARIIQGEPVPDPARFARTMSQIMERGL